MPGWRLGWVIVNDRNNVFGKEVSFKFFFESLEQKYIIQAKKYQYIYRKTKRNGLQFSVRGYEVVSSVANSEFYCNI